MEVIYYNKKVELQCTNLKEANKLFGGNKELVVKLQSRIRYLNEYVNLKDLINDKRLRFHSLKGERKGYFAIDIKTKKEPWRLILQPLNKDKKPYVNFKIDELCAAVKIVEIREVSKHYE